MHKIVEWSPDLNLSEFYKRAAEKGFVNNASQKVMIDCFAKEREWNAWILYNKENKAIGSIAVHSFDDVMGKNSYRIARTCVLDGVISKGLMTAKTILQRHQNLSDQFLVPACLNWIGKKGKIYSTTNCNKEASQRLVHKLYFPNFEQMGIAKKRINNLIYRNTNQTVWEIFPEKFFESLNLYPRWV